MSGVIKRVVFGCTFTGFGCPFFFFLQNHICSNEETIQTDQVAFSLYHFIIAQRRGEGAYDVSIEVPI
jgi:hypothetical protein